MGNVHVLFMAFLMILGSSVCLAQNGHDLFQKALVKERTEGDLEAAIALHERIAKECTDDRPLAAKALLHLGQCYEKLGKDEARKTYERLVQDYADQTEAVAEARTRLAALSEPAGSETGFLSRQVWVEADGVFDGAPSPDGRYMSYLDWGSGNLAVRELEAQTNRLVTTEGTWDEPPQYTEASRWSPDGRQLAYTWNTSGSGSELRILTVQDPKPRVLIREEADAGWVTPEDAIRVKPQHSIIGWRCGPFCAAFGPGPAAARTAESPRLLPLHFPSRHVILAPGRSILEGRAMASSGPKFPAEGTLC